MPTCLFLIDGALTVQQNSPQALFGDLDEFVKLAAEVKAKKDILEAAGGDHAMQLAQLVALEHLIGVAVPFRTKEVSISSLFLRDIAIFLGFVPKHVHSQTSFTQSLLVEFLCSAVCHWWIAPVRGTFLVHALFIGLVHLGAGCSRAASSV
jgi:hypothetical protein